MTSIPYEDPTEQNLTQILEFTLNISKYLLNSKKQYAQLQSFLIDYETNQELIHIIHSVLKFVQNLTQKMQHKNLDNSHHSQVDEEEYMKLEQTLQKYEAQARAHVKSQQQFKMYCDQLEEKIRDLEASKHQVVVDTKETILQLKKQNELLVDKVKKLQEMLIIQKRKAEVDKRQSSERRDYGEVRKDSRDNLCDRRSLNPKNQPSQYPGKLSKKREIPKRQSSLRKKLNEYSKPMQTVEVSRSRKGSVSQAKLRDKKYVER